MIGTRNPLMLRFPYSLKPDKNFWVQLWQVLPADTEIMDTRVDHTPPNYPDRILEFKLASKEFDYTHAWESVPEMLLHFKLENGLKTGRLTSITVNEVEPLWFKEAMMKKEEAQKPEPIRMPAATYLEALTRGMQVPKGALNNCICDMAYTGLKTHRKDCPCHP